jgi:hypothetical protein
MITAHDIQQIEARRRNIKKDTYKHILELFDKKIRSAVALGFPHATMDVPPFVWGFPVYDIASAQAYLKRQLQKLGYTVQEQGNTLKVTWGKAQLAPISEGPDDEEGLPSLVNLRKIASKIIKQNRNAGNRRSA